MVNERLKRMMVIRVIFRTNILGFSCTVFSATNGVESREADDPVTSIRV
jgi:hypothetical protein